MHRILTAAYLAAAATLTLTACDPAADGSKSIAPAVTTTAAVPTPTATTAAPVGTLPRLIGKPLSTARKAARTAGFPTVNAHDATGAMRAQITESDWKVCFQLPGPGAAELSSPVALAVVLTAETCPPADGRPTATPTPTPRSTPTPTPAPTTSKPRPKATTARSGNGTSGGSTSGGGSSSGGSSTSGGGSSTSGGGSGGSSGGGQTEPPVDDHGGATALCNDGTLSFAAHHQGACSHHHGVAVFYK